MNYTDFEDAISSERMSRYVTACNGDTRKAMTLYRYNLQVSQEMFTIVSCFEVTLRNRIDRHMQSQFGADWLKESVVNNGIFTLPILSKTRDIIFYAYRKLNRDNLYTHPKLLPKWNLGFGNICFRLYNMLKQGEIYCKYFQISLAHRRDSNTINGMYLTNWIKSIRCATA